MSLQNVQVEFAELLIANEQETALVKPAVNMIIYHNNLLSHMLGALRNTYPLTVKLVGEDAFKAAAHHYIERYPSTSGNLDEYGEYFSDFIADFEPAAELPYLADVAKFEWAAQLLSRAADANSFNPALLEQLSENDYADLHMVLHPATHLMQTSYPIPAIIDLCKGNISEIDSLVPETLYLLLYRCKNDILISSLTPAAFEFLQQSQNGYILSDCLQTAINLDPEFNLPDHLVNWVKNQIIIDFN